MPAVLGRSESSERPAAEGPTASARSRSPSRTWARASASWSTRQDEATAKKAAKEAFARVARLECYHERLPFDQRIDAIVRESGRAGGKGFRRPVRRPARSAQRVSADSDGAFDVTVGPVVRLWRQARKDATLARPGETRRRAGAGRLQARRDRREGEDGAAAQAGDATRPRRHRQGLRRRRDARVLAKHGLTRALVAAGGDITVADAAAGQGGLDGGDRRRGREERRAALPDADATQRSRPRATRSSSSRSTANAIRTSSIRERGWACWAE